MAIVRYTGTGPTCFTGASVEPGDVFPVPDELVEAYLRRADLVLEPEDDAVPAPSLAEPTTIAVVPSGTDKTAVVVAADATTATSTQEG